MFKFVGAASAIIALFFAIRKLYQWLNPISIKPSIHYPKDGAERGMIAAEIVNKSNETQYIVGCKAIGTYSLKSIISKHLEHPFTKPRFYNTIWFGTITFQILNNSPLKLEPFEPKKLKHCVTEHPLAYFDTSLFLIEVELSTGRKFRSAKLFVPNFWHFSSCKQYQINKNA